MVRQSKNHPHLASAIACHIAFKAYTQQQDCRWADGAL